MPKCKKCNAEFIEGDKFCPGCGFKIIEQKSHCVKCGNKISSDDEFCGSCGNDISDMQNKDQIRYGDIDDTGEQSSFDYYKQVLNKYSDFDGRSTKAEYWYFMLYNIIIAILIAILGIIIGDAGILYVLYLFITFIPQLAVSVRRLHDIGKSGWIFLVSLIPLIGFLWMLILFTTDSDSGVNKYGPNPK